MYSCHAHHEHGRCTLGPGEALSERRVEPGAFVATTKAFQLIKKAFDVTPWLLDRFLDDDSERGLTASVLLAQTVGTSAIVLDGAVAYLDYSYRMDASD